MGPYIINYIILLPEDDCSVNLAIQKERMRKGVNVIDINFSSIQSELLQDNKNANSKHTTSPPMLTMGSFNPMNHSDFQASRYENLGMRLLIYGAGKVEYLLFRHCFNLVVGY